MGYAPVFDFRLRLAVRGWRVSRRDDIGRVVILELLCSRLQLFCASG